MLLLIFEALEVPHDLPAAQRLAVAVVAVPEVLHPYALECVQVLSSDGQHLLIQDPVDHIGAGRVGETALVVVEAVLGVGQLLRGGVALCREGLEELVEGDLVYLAEVVGSQLLDEGVRLVAYLEEEADNSQGLLIVLLFGAIDELVHDVDLEVVLHVVETVLCGSVHMHVVHLVDVGALAVEVSHFDTAQVASLELN